MTDPKDANNMMIMLTGMCGQDDIVEMLQNAIDGFKSNPGDETWMRLAAICSMLLMKEIQLKEGKGKDPMIAALDMMKNMREFDAVNNLLKPNKQ